MAVFGLGTKHSQPEQKDATKKIEKVESKPSNQANEQSAEAKAILAKMEAKKDAGECAFC